MATNSTSTEAMKSIEEQNKALMREYLDGFWNKGDPAVADKFVHPDVVLYDVPRQVIKVPPGLAGLKQNMYMLRKALPDMYMAIEDLIAEGDKVVVRYVAHGTHRGSLQGVPATHRRAKLEAISIVRIENGKIVEGWQEANQIGMMQELGVMPSGPLPLPMRLFIAIRGWLTARREKMASG